MRTIAHISDIHFDRVDANVVEGLLRDIHEFAPSLVVVSGDLTQRGRRGQYQRAAVFLSRLPSSRLVVPGNHDISLFAIWRRMVCPLRRFRRFITPDLLPVFRDVEVIVMGINTARAIAFSWDGFWKDGRVSRDQLACISQVMNSAPPDLFKVLVTHHPFIPPPGERLHGVVHGASEALHVLQECGIDLLLAGHLHMGYSGDVRTHHEAVTRTMLSVQAGTATSTRRRGEPNAYNRLTLSGQTITIEVRSWSGDRFVTTAEIVHPRHADCV
ncbi:MAG: metallophosphoesterase family protein [Tepidisphaeraceae bacterium]